ncbi:MAG: hypothetical protein RBS78_07345 [Coriobacteriia bacterium]|nr:hypothetical protein [Coriobacteriia bacterium]
MLTGIDLSRWAMGLAAVFIAAVVVPWVGMRMLAPSLAHSGRTVRNYRGVQVPLGLGTVWVFWGAAVLVQQAAFSVLGLWRTSGVPLWLNLTQAVPLVLGAFTLGLLDDMFGTPGHKGFKGHLAAVRSGQLTTGGLKLFGIGLLAAAGAAGLSTAAWGPWYLSLVHYVVVVALIALSANTVNLFDLRPLRALKAYSLLAFVAIAAGTAMLMVRGLAPTLAVCDGVLVLMVAAGPAVAVWRPDATEKGMLGDAGANACGMFAGVMLASALPLLAAAVAAAGLLALNLVSERVSFSALIERTAWLARIDAWGRACFSGGTRPQEQKAKP